jgi:hypothetical protein
MILADFRQAHRPGAAAGLQRTEQVQRPQHRMAAVNRMNQNRNNLPKIFFAIQS